MWTIGPTRFRRSLPAFTLSMGTRPVPSPFHWPTTILTGFDCFVVRPYRLFAPSKRQSIQRPRPHRAVAIATRSAGARMITEFCRVLATIDTSLFFSTAAGCPPPRCCICCIIMSCSGVTRGTTTGFLRANSTNNCGTRSARRR